MKRITYAILILLSVIYQTGTAQTAALTMKDALQTALSNYGSIQAKNNYLNASRSSVEQVKKDYLPNFVISGQQDYGTINGQNGPLFGYGGFGVASSGLALEKQNWNAAFGALYLANVNWEFYTFGRVKARTKLAESIVARDENDLEQEMFQHQVKVAGAYLNLLAYQRITRSQEKNLERTIIFKTYTVARVLNGLIAGVDSSQANAEVSSARIALTRARDAEQEQANRLSVLLGVNSVDFQLDTAFVSRIPARMLNVSALNPDEHPLLQYYKSRITIAQRQSTLIERANYPSMSMFGIVQDRASGFEPGYLQDQEAFTRNYFTGIKPTRINYLFGVGLSWNLSNFVKTRPQLQGQQFITQALKNEYDLVDQQLKAQRTLADTKIKNALDNYNEAPVQVKAATDAYNQKNALYKNGLTTIVEVTQTLYTLNRAETDRDVAYSNVWQALLLKAAAAGDLDLFIKEF